ncbi:MAG: sigma-E factor negative regulatory protein [Gammaproteobacteria bacterium]
MSELLNEQVSAGVDDELDPGEAGLLLRRLASDVGLRQRWQRYHLISDALKNNLPAQLPVNLAERIARAIAAQPAPTRRVQPGRLLRPLAGFAIAASVAAVAVLGMRSLHTAVDNPPTEQIASAAALPAALPVAVSQPNGTRWDRAQPEVAARLNAYLVNHNGHAESSGMQSVLPYVRIVGYDVGE